MSSVDKLRSDARNAAEVRALTTHPDVVALRAERVRTAVDGLFWTGILLALAFTMVNVQQFAAAGAPVGSLPWLSAWLLDPMVSLVLIAVLLAEQVTARWQVTTGRWVRRTKVFAFAATYVMNTWTAWAALHPAGIVLHSVPPLLVLATAEAAPHLRERITEAVLKAAQMAVTTTATSPTEPPAPPPAPQPVNAPTIVQDTAEEPAPKPVRERRPVARKAVAKRPVVKPARKLLADFLTEARAAYQPGVEVTPAWVRSVTDCARGTSKNVADALNAEVTASRWETSPASDGSPAEQPQETAGQASDETERRAA
ncbi:hypothetical protein GCM10029964_000550 [Kibdelosporangium lantanae]